jgi:hypothetical protein
MYDRRIMQNGACFDREQVTRVIACLCGHYALSVAEGRNNARDVARELFASQSNTMRAW